MSLKIVMIAGKAGWGKTSLAKILQEYKKDIEILSFAQPVKEIALEVFGWDGRKDTQEKRQLLQLIGKAGRLMDKDFWVNRLIKRITDYKTYVIDDWRFDNEFLHLVTIFPGATFRLIYVNRPDHYDPCHIDETENSISKSLIHYNIPNAASYDVLRFNALQLIKEGII